MEVKEQVSKGENAIYFLNIGMLKQQLAFSGIQFVLRNQGDRLTLQNID